MQHIVHTFNTFYYLTKMNLKCKITRLLVEAAKLGFLSLPQTQKAYQWKITGMPLWVGCYNQHWRLGDEHQTSWVAKNICTAVSGLCTNPKAYHKRCESNGQTQPIRMIEKSENNINDKVKKLLPFECVEACDHHISNWDFLFTAGV